MGPQENNLISLRLTFFFCKRGSSNFLPRKGAVKLNSQVQVKHRDTRVTGRHWTAPIALEFPSFFDGHDGWCCSVVGPPVQLAQSLSWLLPKYQKMRLLGCWEIMTKTISLEQFLWQDSEKFFKKKKKALVEQTAFCHWKYIQSSPLRLISELNKRVAVLNHCFLETSGC